MLAKIPKEARAKTQKGAEAFAMFYMRQVNEAFTKADSSFLADLAKPGCNICRRFAEGADDMKKEGVRHKGLSIEPTSASVSISDESSPQVLVWTTQHAVPVVDDSGTRVRTTTGAKGIFVMTLSYDARWWVTKLQVGK